MPRANNKRRRKKEYSPAKEVFKWVLTIAAVGVIILAITAVFHEDIEENLDEINYPREYSEYVEKAAKDYDLDPALIYAVIRTESGFNPEAISNVGAYGIMQVMPSSFEWLQSLRGEEGTYTAEDLLDPAVCIDYGSYLLKYNYDLYENEECAVAAYNAGFIVGEWLENSEYSSDGKTLDVIPYPETEEYVKMVEEAKDMYIKIYYS